MAGQAMTTQVSRRLRFRAVVFVAGVVALAAAAPSPVQAQVQALSVTATPIFSSTTQVGRQNQAAALRFQNTSQGFPLNTQSVQLTNIRLNPSCASSSLGHCSQPEPRPLAGAPIFRIDSPGVGRGSTSCAGIVFTMSAPDASGTVLLTPSAPVFLGPSSGASGPTFCDIDFTFDVMQRPLDGVTTPIVRVDAHTAGSPSITASGSSPTVTVTPAPTTIVTNAGPQLVAEGTSFSDLAFITGVQGGPFLTGNVVFRLYRSDPPLFPTCTGAPFLTSAPIPVSIIISDPPSGPPQSMATFAPSPPPPAGNYVFVATYDEGDTDANYASVTSPCADPNERVTVTPGAIPGGTYTPLTPARIEDTRTGVGGLSGPIGPNSTVDVQVTGRGGVPAGASAVVLNVTVTQPTADSFLTLYPSGNARPLAANVNFSPNKTVPNLVVVKLGTDGRVAMYNFAGSVHVIYDVAGYFTEGASGPGGRYQPLVPARIADTRTSGLRLGPGQSLDVQVTGRGGAPAAGVSAAVLNVAVTNATAPSFLTIFPTGEAQPLASNLNFAAGDTVSNRTMTRVGLNGRVTIYNNAGNADVIVDLGGTFTDTSVAGVNGRYTALPPSRILDTRSGAPIPGNGAIEVAVTGTGGVPASGVSAVILNVAVTQPVGIGYLTIYPKGAPQPLASDLNYAPGETRANLVVARVGTDGKVILYTSSQAHVVFDVAGWFN